MAQKKSPYGLLKCERVCKDTHKKGLSALYFASFHALGAYIGFANMTVLVLNGDFLNVGLKPTVRHAMRVADAATCCRGLATNFTNLRHCSSLHIRHISVLATCQNTVDAKSALKL